MINSQILTHLFEQKKSVQLICNLSTKSNSEQIKVRDARAVVNQSTEIWIYWRLFVKGKVGTCLKWLGMLGTRVLVLYLSVWHDENYVYSSWKWSFNANMASLLIFWISFFCRESDDKSGPRCCLFPPDWTDGTLSPVTREWLTRVRVLVKMSYVMSVGF